MFWRRLSGTLGASWTRFVDEIDRNSQAVRQSTAAAVVFAAAAAAMPAMADRGAEQRADADWAARAMAFQKDMQAQQLAAEDPARAAKAAEPAARMELAATPTPFGWQSRG